MTEYKGFSVRSHYTVARNPGPGGLRLHDVSGKWVVAAAVLGSGMASLDATVVNVALPALGRDLHAGFDRLQWVISGYTLTLASLILLGGSLGDRFGRRRMFIIGTVWFALASALCAFAPSVEILVLARSLEGVGGALLTPGSLAMIQASFVEQDRGKAIGAWSGFGGVASAIGPFIGGYLVEGPGWRWVFLINLPVAVLVIAIARRHVPESFDPQAPRHLDVFGAALGSIGLGGLTYALIGAGGGWSAVSVFSLVLGLVALGAFVVNERHSPNPMIPPGIFRNRQFTAANVVTFLVYAALGGVFFFLVIDLQVVAGFSPVLAGSALLPVTVIMLLLSAQAGALSAKIGPRLPMSLGPLAAACGVLLLLRIGPGAAYVFDVLPGVTVIGLGLALMVAPLTTTVLAAVPTEHAGVASGINNAVARAAGLLAVAALPLLVGISGDDYQHPQAFATGFRIAMMLCAALLATGGIVAGVTIRNPRRPHIVKAPLFRQFCAIDAPPLQPTTGRGAAVVSASRSSIHSVHALQREFLDRLLVVFRHFLDEVHPHARTQLDSTQIEARRRSRSGSSVMWPAANAVESRALRRSYQPGSPRWTACPAERSGAWVRRGEPAVGDYDRGPSVKRMRFGMGQRLANVPTGA